MIKEEYLNKEFIKYCIDNDLTISFENGFQIEHIDGDYLGEHEILRITYEITGNKIRKLRKEKIKKIKE